MSGIGVGLGPALLEGCMGLHTPDCIPGVFYIVLGPRMSAYHVSISEMVQSVTGLHIVIPRLKRNFGTR